VKICLSGDHFGDSTPRFISTILRLTKSYLLAKQNNRRSVSKIFEGGRRKPLVKALATRLPSVILQDFDIHWVFPSA